MNSRLFLVYLFLCLVLVTKAEEKEEVEVNDELEEEVDVDNNVDDSSDTKVDSTDTQQTTELNTNAITTTTGATVEDELGNEDINSAEMEARIDTIVNTNTTLDACGHTSKQFGIFSFYKPISKSVLPVYTNFTIIWYYNNIIYDSYTYPTNNITLSLFFEEDANANDWANAWQNPVWEETIPMSKIEEGPTLTNNVRTYQWNWRLLYNETGQDTKNFKQALRTNEKYKLRISGDGKDIQRNPDLKCYQDGDIAPGATRPFFIVDNNKIPSYGPLAIPDHAFARVSRSPVPFILPLLTILVYLFMN